MSLIVCGRPTAGMLSAQEQSDRYAEIINPKLLHINREEPRSTFSSFTDLKEALAAGYISKGSDVCSFMDLITGTPKEIFGTNCPSITSRWTISTPHSSNFFK